MKRNLKIDYVCYNNGQQWRSSCEAHYVDGKMDKEKIKELEKDFALNLEVEKVCILSWYDLKVRK